VLPFLAMAPGALIKDVVTTQFDRANVEHRPPLPRLADLVGLSQFSHLSQQAVMAIVLSAAVLVGLGYLAACRAGRRRPARLDAYALIGVLAVTAMLLWPYGYWQHYGAVAGPFIALVLALPAGLLRPAEHRGQIAPLLAVSAVAGVLIMTAGLRQFGDESRLHASTTLSAAADGLIKPGSCVVTDFSSLVITADRFFSTAADCPDMVDSYGTLLTMTDGRKWARPGEISTLAALWQSQFAAASYVWLEYGDQGRIPWTPALYTYFTSHFRLLGLLDGRGSRFVPEGGLYVRRAPAGIGPHPRR
jgi:hypothetical protein